MVVCFDQLNLDQCRVLQLTYLSPIFFPHQALSNDHKLVVKTQKVKTNFHFTLGEGKIKVYRLSAMSMTGENKWSVRKSPALQTRK